MLDITAANTRNLPTRPIPRLGPDGREPRRFSKRCHAMDAAVRTLGPLARNEFEYEVVRVDGWWIWKRIDDARAPTLFQAKINGGKHAAARIASARKTHTVKVVLELPPDQALALAQMCKRITFEDVQRMSENPQEHDRMDSAITKLGSALKVAGSHPR